MGRIIGNYDDIYTHMKKSELTQLTQIIEHIVAREVRKQLPAIIAETFQNMMGNKQVVNEARQQVREAMVQPEPETVEDDKYSAAMNMKASLRELFAGTPVMKQPEPQVPQTKQYTKNPVLNQILNETTGDLRAREMMVGAAAFQGGYSPGVAMAAAAMPMAAATGAGPMMDESEIPSFARNIPTIPVGRPPVLSEGQASTHAPMAAIPEGLSALDVVKHTQAAPEVKHALTRNYSQMMKLIDKKKKGVL